MTFTVETVGCRDDYALNRTLAAEGSLTGPRSQAGWLPKNSDSALGRFWCFWVTFRVHFCIWCWQHECCDLDISCFDNFLCLC